MHQTPTGRRYGAVNFQNPVAGGVPGVYTLRKLGGSLLRAAWPANHLAGPLRDGMVRGSATPSPAKSLTPDTPAQEKRK